MLRDMHAAGFPLPGVKILGDSEPISVQEIKEASPETFVAFRYYRPDDGGPSMTAAEWFPRFIDPFPGRHGADAYQITCEWDQWDEASIAWRIDQMRWCEAHSSDYPKHLLEPGWSTGTPPGDPMDTYGRGYIQDFMGFVRDHGHYFSLDEYFRNDGDFELFRFLHRVWPYLPPSLRDNMPPVVFAEFSQDGIAYLSYDGLNSLLRTWGTELRKYPFVKTALIYLLGLTGNLDWAAYNIAPNMRVLADVNRPVG